MLGFLRFADEAQSTTGCRRCRSGRRAAPPAAGRTAWPAPRLEDECVARAVEHRKNLIDTGERARPMRDNDHDRAARRAPMMACVNALSPSESRLEFGSSSTIRNGSR